MIPWLLVALAVVVLALAGLAATGRLGQVPEPPVEDVWIAPGGHVPDDRRGAMPDDPEATEPRPATPGDDPSDLSLPDTG